MPAEPRTVDLTVPPDPCHEGDAARLARRSAPRGRPRPFLLRAALLAASVSVVALCTGDAAARNFPFGSRSRSVSDLGNQYVPFYAHLWDLLHGRGDGGWFINWQSGYGASFLPDVGTYLSSPFSLLVVLFPRERVDLAVYVISVAKTACAAAVMTCLLLRLRPGRWWAAGALGGSYALCGWSVAEAAYNPMWLDGLIALPLLCLVGEWAIEGRRTAAGALVVALAWTANFYTAYMATIGAALVLLLRLGLSEAPGARRLRAPGRAAVSTALGVALAAPLLLTVWRSTRQAVPGRRTAFLDVPWSDTFAGMLPGAWRLGTPSGYLDSTALLLALTLPFHRAVPVRVRTGWTALVVAVALSMHWEPTHLAWHVFTTPNGSPFRQAFVLCGLLVIAGWLSFAHGLPDRRAVLAATGVLALIAVAARPSGMASVFTLPLLVLGCAGVLTGLLLLAGASRRPLLGWFGALALIGVQLGQSAVTTAVVDHARRGRLDDYPVVGHRQERQRETVAEADGWPRYRTDPGREQTVANDPLVVGGQGAQYYSSHTSAELSDTLTALGGGWTSRARSVQSLDNPVVDALFSVGARVHNPPDPYRVHASKPDFAPYVTRADAPPLVTVRPRGPRPAFGQVPFANQELLLGAHVYTVPRTRQRAVDGSAAVRLRSGAHRFTAPFVVRANCPAGSQVQLWAPRFKGTAHLAAAGSRTAVMNSDLHGRKRAAMQPLGTVPGSGRVRITLTPDDGGTGEIPATSVGCLDPERLRAAVHRLTVTGATAVSTSDDGVTARLPARSRGVAVIATPAVEGWRCAVSGAPLRTAEEYLGLLAVRLDSRAPAAGQTVHCTFRPPGLRPGALVGGAGLTALTGLAVIPLVRRRAPEETRNR